MVVRDELFVAVGLIAGSALLTGACTQMTKHSNTMVFGTNTSIGLSVGTGATQIPAIDVGYKRQEAVIMPLLANTDTKDEGKTLLPCKEIVNGGTGNQVNSLGECKFMGSKDGSNTDTYSVLASFGAKFNAETADLDLVVDAVQELDVAVRQVPGKVASLVEASLRTCAEWVWDEYR